MRPNDLHPVFTALLSAWVPPKPPQQTTEAMWLAVDRSLNLNKTERHEAEALAHQIKHEGRNAS